MSNVLVGVENLFSTNRCHNCERLHFSYANALCWFVHHYVIDVSDEMISNVIDTRRFGEIWLPLYVARQEVLRVRVLDLVRVTLQLFVADFVNIVKPADDF